MVLVFVEYYDHTLVDLGLVSKHIVINIKRLVAPSVEHQRQIQARVSIVVTFQDNGDSHMRLRLAQREAVTTPGSLEHIITVIIIIIIILTTIKAIYRCGQIRRTRIAEVLEGFPEQHCLELCLKGGQRLCSPNSVWKRLSPNSVWKCVPQPWSRATESLVTHSV